MDLFILFGYIFSIIIATVCCYHKTVYVQKHLDVGELCVYTILTLVPIFNLIMVLIYLDTQFNVYSKILWSKKQ
jgi:hypothetical protein